MRDIRESTAWLIDMDGVLVHEGQLITGADKFLTQLTRMGKRYCLLTNNSMYTPSDLHARLKSIGLDVPSEMIYTAGLATARFLDNQRPRGSAFVMGEAGLVIALHNVGYTLTDLHPDYVVIGETRAYSFTEITKAIRLIGKGARFIATNPDPVNLTSEGSLPTTGSISALITKATGVEPYYIGKPNPLMMRTALDAMGGHSESTALIGDRMDTDIVAGLEAGFYTILVLSGVTTEEEIERFPYQPSRVVQSVEELTEVLSDGSS